MKRTMLQMAIAIIPSGVAAYWGNIKIPILLLLIAMLLDFATGISNAGIKRKISSQKAREGVKKKAAEFALIGVGVLVDTIILYVERRLGLSILPMSMFFGILVVLWLCIKELISILENISALGVPIPAFLRAVIAKLEKSV